jgi:RHS repeat-associated protein
VIRYQYDDHLGSSCLELDANANIISYEEYHPFGTTSYRAGRSYAETTLKRYKYCGKERDEETGLYYYGARYYAGWLCRFVSVDPMKEARPWVNPYNYCQNNPIARVDPNGMLDDVYITGPDADKTTQALNNSSSLTITRDEATGKLSVSGKAKTAADKMLLEAINSETVDVDLVTKSEATYDSKDGTKGWPLVPGGFEGSEIINGKTIATQYLNFEATENIAKIIGEKTGETIMHEINEAYIGGRDYPGGNYDNAYQGSHNKAAKLDRVKNPIEFNRNTKSDPNNTIMQGRVIGSNNPWTDIIKIPR